MAAILNPFLTATRRGLSAKKGPLNGELMRPVTSLNVEVFGCRDAGLSTR